MKQTAVEWLVNVVQSCIAPDYIPKEIIEQAKAMEKEQIIDFVLNYLIFGKYGTKPMNMEELKIDIKDYYKQLYKSE